MNRPHALLLVAVAALASWLLIQMAGGDPIAPVAGPQINAPAASAEAPSADAAPPSVAAATASRVAVTRQATTRPIPEDSKWLDVRVVDAATKSPVPGAQVRWSTGAAWQRVQALPERERQAFYGNRELVAERFGWVTRTDAEGVARVAATTDGASVHAYADGRYATGYVGDRWEMPAGGWQLELEPDHTLRGQVLDAAERPAVDVQVGILMFDAESKPEPNPGWIPSVVTAAPDGIAEFRHIQTWMRGSGGRNLDGIAWRAAIRLPGLDDPGVAFDRASPPVEPIVLRLPATGTLRARLVHDGKPLIDGVTFSAYRGAANDTDQWNTARRVPVDEDGWARFPHVALGGALTVLAWGGSGSITGEVDGPVANGQEVRLDLDADSIFSLAGGLVGPDGKPLADTTVMADFDAEIQSGGAQVKTDSQGRFFWLLTKGYIDKPTLSRLVLSLKPDEGSPLRVSVPPRELTRGVNDLGFLRLTHGSLVVAGRVVFDPPDEHRAWFMIEALADRRGRSGEERWQQVRELTTVVRPDGLFEVRGETKPVRHRLNFPAGDHLPIAPLEFRIGADDLVVPLAIGNRLAAKVLVPEGLPRQRVRGLLRPHGEVPEEPTPEFDPMGNRYVARDFGAGGDDVRLQWQALPSGTYTLQICGVGMQAPLLAVDDVVLPQPAGGDPRLEAIDLRDAVRVVKLKVALDASVTTKRWVGLAAFPLPQHDKRGWEGVPVPTDGVVLALPKDPIELLVAGEGWRPQRVLCAGSEVEVHRSGPGRRRPRFHQRQGGASATPGFPFRRV